MLIQDIARAYETKTDEELLQLATESEQLTLEAHSALTTELARRRIDSAGCWERAFFGFSTRFTIVMALSQSGLYRLPRLG